MDNIDQEETEVGYITGWTWENRFIDGSMQCGEFNDLLWLLPEEVNHLLRLYMRLEFDRIAQDTILLSPYYYGFQAKCPLRIKSKCLKKNITNNDKKERKKILGG